MTQTETWTPSPEDAALIERGSRLSPEQYSGNEAHLFRRRHFERHANIRSGQRCLRGRRLCTEDLRGFLLSGDRLSDVAEDYGLNDAEAAAIGIEAAEANSDPRPPLQMSRAELWDLAPKELAPMTELYLNSPEPRVSQLSYMAEELVRAAGWGLPLIQRLCRHPEVLVREGALMALGRLTTQQNLDFARELQAEARAAAQQKGPGQRSAELTAELAMEACEALEEALSLRPQGRPGQWWVIRPWGGADGEKLGVQWGAENPPPAAWQDERPVQDGVLAEQQAPTMQE